jgi:hypothetical protein
MPEYQNVNQKEVAKNGGFLELSTTPQECFEPFGLFGFGKQTLD